MVTHILYYQSFCLFSPRKNHTSPTKWRWSTSEDTRGALNCWSQRNRFSEWFVKSCSCSTRNWRFNQRLSALSRKQQRLSWLVSLKTQTCVACTPSASPFCPGTSSWRNGFGGGPASNCKVTSCVFDVLDVFDLEKQCLPSSPWIFNVKDPQVLCELYYVLVLCRSIYSVSLVNFNVDFL